MGTVHHLHTRDNLHDAVVKEVTGALRRLVESGQSFEALETTLLDITNEACRSCLEERLQQAADELDGELLIDGTTYRQHQPGTVVYHSLCGPLSVCRWTYRQVGVRNAPTVVPLELANGLAERSTPALAFAIARAYADLPMRDYAEHLTAAGRVPPSRSTLERTAKRIGAVAHLVHPRIEPKLRCKEQVPSTAVAINIGLDRTSIPMAEDEDGGVKVHHRMAYIGTFCLTDRDANVLVIRRYAAPACDGPDQLLERLMADVSHSKRQRPGLQVGVVQDGAAELWNLMGEALRANPDVNSWRETYDRYHVMEKLSLLLTYVEQDPAVRQKLRAEWNKKLDTRARAIVAIDNWLFARVHQIKNRQKREEAARILGCYFINDRQFRYATLKGTGLLQGSGVTEAACKTMIAQRTKRSGQRWRPEGIRAVLALRTICESERMTGFWKHFSGRYRATVRAAA